MYIPKKYGQSKISKCPFCSKTAVTENIQGIPVCVSHKNEKLSDIRCACGEYLDVMEGKWGPYFRCIKCGNINSRKGLEMSANSLNSRYKKTEPEQHVKKDKGAKTERRQDPRKEITITSDEVDTYYS